MLTEDYICDTCGNTTPVQSDVCPSCGAPMKIDKPKTSPTGEDRSGTEEESSGELAEGSEESTGHQDGSESLEALQDEEEKDEAEGDDYAHQDQ